MSYFLESFTWQISGKKASTYLCQDKDSGEIKWRQAFEMNPNYWEELAFSDRDLALNFIRDMYKENSEYEYYFCEDKEKILAVNKLENTVGETSMRIVEGK